MPASCCVIGNYWDCPECKKADDLPEVVPSAVSDVFLKIMQEEYDHMLRETFKQYLIPKDKWY